MLHSLVYLCNENNILIKIQYTPFINIRTCLRKKKRRKKKEFIQLYIYQKFHFQTKKINF